MALELQEQIDQLLLAGHRGLDPSSAKYSTQKLCAHPQQPQSPPKREHPQGPTS